MGATGVWMLAMRSGRDERAARAEAVERALRGQIPRIRRLVTRLMGRGEDLDDVVQEVLVQCIRSLHTIENPAAVDGWVTSVATFVVRGTLRGRGRFRRRIECVAEPPDAASEAPGASETVTARMALERVQAALEAMDPTLREVFVLRVLEAVPLEELAAWLGVSLATAKRRVSAAHEAFNAIAQQDPRLSAWIAQHGETT